MKNYVDFINATLVDYEPKTYQVQVSNVEEINFLEFTKPFQFHTRTYQAIKPCTLVRLTEGSVDHYLRVLTQGLEDYECEESPKTTLFLIYMIKRADLSNLKLQNLLIEVMSSGIFLDNISSGSILQIFRSWRGLDVLKYVTEKNFLKLVNSFESHNKLDLIGAVWELIYCDGGNNLVRFEPLELKFLKDSKRRSTYTQKLQNSSYDL